MSAHRRIRPPALAGSVLYLNKNNRWARDDGDKHVAFIGLDEHGAAVVWVGECECVVYAKCIASKAASAACDRWGGVSIVRISP